MSEAKLTLEVMRRITSAANVLAPVFAANEWRWCVRDGEVVECYVPTADDIAIAFGNMLKKCEPGGEIQGGRLMVRAATEHTERAMGWPAEFFLQVGYGDGV